MSDVVLSQESTDDGLLVTIEGVLNETCNFDELAQIRQQRVILDLSGIRRINSSGIRIWVRFIRSFTAANQVTLQRCSVPFVHQLSVLKFMSGSGEVASVMAPYICEQCDTDHIVVIDLSQGELHIAESMPCPACGKRMVFDDVVESYLAFLDG